MKEIYTIEEVEKLLPLKGYYTRDENGNIDILKVIYATDEIGYELEIIDHIEGEIVFMQKRLIRERRRKRRKQGKKLWWL